MIDDVKELYGEKTDSKAIMILIRWGHKAIFGKQTPKR